MEETLLAKRIFEEMKQESFKNIWYEDIKRIQNKLHDTWGKPGTWTKGMIKRMCEHSENESWKTEKERHDKLQLYPKENLKGRMKYLDNSETSKIFCRLRINDTRRKTGQQIDTCSGMQSKSKVYTTCVRGLPHKKP